MLGKRIQIWQRLFVGFFLLWVQACAAQKSLPPVSPGSNRVKVPKASEVEKKTTVERNSSDATEGFEDISKDSSGGSGSSQNESGVEEEKSSTGDLRLTNQVMEILQNHRCTVCHNRYKLDTWAKSKEENVCNGFGNGFCNWMNVLN